MNPKVDLYFLKNKEWQKEIGLLRKIVLDCGLTEELKWGVPCYTFCDAVSAPRARNIVLIHVFKHYCALLFFKGALMRDPAQILVQQTENVQAARQVRFTSASEIVRLKSLLKSYIYEAIEIEKAGLKVELKKVNEYPVPAEFKTSLSENKALDTAFKALTPGRQRAYLLYFSQAKLPATRLARVEKSIPQILAGKGLND